MTEGGRGGRPECADLGGADYRVLEAPLSQHVGDLPIDLCHGIRGMRHWAAKPERFLYTPGEIPI